MIQTLLLLIASQVAAGYLLFLVVRQITLHYLKEKQNGEVEEGREKVQQTPHVGIQSQSGGGQTSTGRVQAPQLEVAIRHEDVQPQEGKIKAVHRPV